MNRSTKCGISMQWHITQLQIGLKRQYMLQHKCTSKTLCYMEEARYKKLQVVWFHLHETPRRDESIDSEQTSGFQGLHMGEGGVNGKWPMGTESPLGRWWCFPTRRRGQWCSIMNLLTPLNCILHEFYLNKKIKPMLSEQAPCCPGPPGCLANRGALSF